MALLGHHTSASNSGEAGRVKLNSPIVNTWQAHHGQRTGRCFSAWSFSLCFINITPLSLAAEQGGGRNFFTICRYYFWPWRWVWLWLRTLGLVFTDAPVVWWCLEGWIQWRRTSNRPTVTFSTSAPAVPWPSNQHPVYKATSRPSILR